MEFAKITSKGQITIPLSVRKQLGVKDGDKVMFVQEGERIILMNATVKALLDAQEAFRGVAEEIDVHDEQDVVNLVKEIRAERSSLYTVE